MNPSRKKELADSYKQRKVTGGVYTICCQPTGKRIIEITTDMTGAKNRFDFSAQTNLCPTPLMRADWNKYGAASFVFTALETVPKKDEEDMGEYKKGLELLRDMLRAEAPENELYGESPNIDS